MNLVQLQEARGAEEQERRWSLHMLKEAARAGSRPQLARWAAARLAAAGEEEEGEEEEEDSAEVEGEGEGEGEGAA